ncbi:MAG: hypothetical protein IPM64_16050 [Phycisphaerales bacterium]|nr:hypothetical protein [Phycisphaerales bacterium]
MGATIQALLDLQEVELQVADIRRQVASREKRVAAQQARVQAGQKELAAHRDQTRTLQIEFDALDLDVKSRDGGVARLREQLNTVRTNKEYQAILAEMNNARAEIARIEARGMELMQQIETRKTEADARAAQIAVEETRFAELRGELERAQQSFSERLARLTAERDAAAAKVHPEVLKQFNRISERYDGEVMARVSRPNPRRDEFICEGCNMSVSAERASALMSRDDVTTCGQCGRILHFVRGG